IDSDDHRPLKKRFVVGHQQAPQQAPQAPQQAPRQQALQQAPRQQARQQAPAQEEPPQEDPPQEVMLDEMIPILIFSACFGVCNSLTRISRWTLKREQRLIIRVCFSVWGESWFVINRHRSRHDGNKHRIRHHGNRHRSRRIRRKGRGSSSTGTAATDTAAGTTATSTASGTTATSTRAGGSGTRWTLKRVTEMIETTCREEDANTAEPPPPLPCRYRSLRSLFKTCPLLGCFLKVEQNRSHCCYGHFQLAREFAQRAVAFHYFDGFLDGEHRKRVCILALLNSVRGLQTGVPNLDHVAGLFTTLPWQLKIIPENAGNWLFFKTPPLRYTSMSYTSTNCGTKPPAIWWKKNPFLSIGFEGFDHPPVKYTLFLMDGGDDHHRQLAKDWRLHLFQCQELSLYCLSTGGSLIFAQPEPKLVKKQNPGDGDTSPTDRDPNPVSKIASSKRHRNLPSTSNSSSVPQVPVGNPQGRGRNSMLSFLAVTEGVACRDGETVELQQIKAKKKIGPSFALKNPDSMLSVLAVTEGVACRDGETVELQQIKAKKKIGPSFALKNLAKTLFKVNLDDVCELHPQDVVFKDQKDAQKMYRFNDLSLAGKETMDQ
ncbi:hypothetical protein HID58_088793, partial [Brassica napus]